jgi:hypothetical protein
MTDSARRIGAPEWLILADAGIFIFTLALSAVFQADIRWMHFFPAWIYLAAVDCISSWSGCRTGKLSKGGPDLRGSRLAGQLSGGGRMYPGLFATAE